MEHVCNQHDWQLGGDYVKNDGTLLVEFLDEGLNTTQTTVEIDFLGVRVLIDGISLDLKNSGPLTTHIIAIWIINSTSHQRYNANLFINSEEELTYVRADIKVPEDDFTEGCHRKRQHSCFHLKVTCYSLIFSFKAFIASF